jgi:F-type H+-transporting ATPase subunit a
MSSIHVSISAEKLFSLGGLEFTNSMVTSLIVSGLLIAFALAVRASIRQTDRPTGLQNIAELIVESLHKMVHGVTGSQRRTSHFFPLIATFFLFILMNNYFGLLPGVGSIGMYESEAEVSETEHSAALVPVVVASEPVAESHAAEPTATTVETAPTTGVTTETEPAAVGGHSEPVFVPYLRAGTADLNTTLALAIISVVMTQIIGVKYLGLSYFKKFLNFSNPIAFFVGFLETISEFAKIVSFAFRLFGNIFAGEVLLVVITSLTKVVAPMPFYGLELFVGFIQALVFSMLSLVFFNMATQSHEAH